ncbi:hypothetical protein ACSTI1_00305, partial [Vibrio parahaemolyticus]
ADPRGRIRQLGLCRCAGRLHLQAEGQAMRELGQFTFVMTRAGKDWKIAGWSWTGPDPSAAK